MESDSDWIRSFVVVIDRKRFTKSIRSKLRLINVYKRSKLWECCWETLDMMK